ncbi:MAG: amidohydrolase family protein [Colwellia sp.]|nr:amidohydrolase family protein [Colwellia sp.]
MRWEDKIGSIVAGKHADYAILAQDPYQVDPKKLKDIKIWGTVFEGKKFPVKH